MVFVLEAERHVLGDYGVCHRALPVGLGHRLCPPGGSIPVRPDASLLWHGTLLLQARSTVP